MAFRGGHGGRGGGFGLEFDRPTEHEHEPHKNFPEIALPEMTCARSINEEKTLILSTLKFKQFLRHSCYHLEKNSPKRKNEEKDIERFSDRKRKTHGKCEAPASYLKLTPVNFPLDLIQGFRQGQPSNKKLRWDRGSDEQAFELFEKLGWNHKDGDKKTEKDGDDNEQEEEEVEEEENSDDDYNQNIEFDDERRKHMKTTMLNDHRSLKSPTPWLNGCCLVSRYSLSTFIARSHFTKKRNKKTKITRS